MNLKKHIDYWLICNPSIKSYILNNVKQGTNVLKYNKKNG